MKSIKLKKIIGEERESNIGSLNDGSLQKEFKKAKANTLPYLWSGRMREICERTIELKRPILIVEKPSQDDRFEEKILYWLNHQVLEKECDASFDKKYWKSLQISNSWVDVFLDGLECNPNSTEINSIIDLMIEDLSFDFKRIYKLLQLCSISSHDKFKEILEVCLVAAQQDSSYVFQLFEFLDEKPNVEIEVNKLIQMAIFSASKDLQQYQQLLDGLVKKEKWNFVKSCCHRMLSKNENYNLSYDIIPVIESLILSYIKINDISLALSCYEKYWLSPNIKQAFKYGGELVYSLHDSSPHHNIIEHICGNLDINKHTKSLKNKDFFALVLEIKRLEFKGKWRDARVHYETLLDSFKVPEKQIAIICFLAYNALYDNDPAIIKSYVFPILEKESLDEYPQYSKIRDTLRICIMDELNCDQAILLCRRLFNFEKNEIEDAELLPSEDVLFSEFLVPRILESLVLSKRLPAYEKSLKQKITIRRLPQNDRLFLVYLIQIEKHLNNRRELFTEEELSVFVDDFVQALHLSLDTRQLEILAQKFTHAHDFISKDKFGDYHFLEAVLLEKYLILKASLNLEEVYRDQKEQLSENNKYQFDKALREMSIHTITQNIRNLA